MRKIITFVLVLCTAFSITGCRFNYENPEEVKETFDKFAGKLGKTQITGDEALIGERQYGEDAYVGSYLADCADQTGKDVIFGGGSIEEREIRVYGTIKSESGKAVVRIRTNEDVLELEPDEEGCFETTLNLVSGGNYVMMNYEDFSGKIELYSEYGGNEEGND